MDTEKLDIADIVYLKSYATRKLMRGMWNHVSVRWHQLSVIQRDSETHLALCAMYGMHYTEIPSGMLRVQFMVLEKKILYFFVLSSKVWHFIIYKSSLRWQATACLCQNTVMQWEDSVVELHGFSKPVQTQGSLPKWIHWIILPDQLLWYQKYYLIKAAKFSWPWQKKNMQLPIRKD